MFRRSVAQAEPDDKLKERAERLEEAFRTFDEDGNGMIDADELLKILTRNGEGCEPLSKDDAQEIIVDFDSTNQGKGLKFDDFVRCWNGVLKDETSLDDVEDLPEMSAVMNARRSRM